MPFEKILCVCGERIALDPARIKRQERIILKNETGERVNGSDYSIKCLQCGATRITKIPLELRKVVDGRYDN